ncbi:alpha-N-acetylglucosaminidase [Streptomyces abyssalis]|uniref:Alpha-N-acetylglucosaminidase n=1 Tax=Streptomyces abyssalis TaxID=933944 RepID=A0A1E7JLX2_9ACTN|nr:alpha-N-acetylglucosaminidase [Streptomyces abyssalis]OEU88644.1 alpha-N-acetylglucosaminidase [Streptomyces abyssalis]OEU91294.1 alpha-N-acetylglucosaminidase [Streptomyces abyssalis]OEV26550.1 alpha-N-acetylglucosaminidase [Streptomyces nanshensis]
MEDINRRTLLGTAGALGAGVALGPSAGPAAAVPGFQTAAAPDMKHASAAVRRLLPDHHDQISFTALTDGEERFKVSGSAGSIEVAGSSPAVALTGLHWYLKYTCAAHISWSGSQTDLPERLPAPGSPYERSATVPHRFMLNDTHDGYTAPYADWDHWERFIDVMALHGCNEVLVTTGSEVVYHRLLKDFGYSDVEARQWIPAPSHQPWWLLQNLSEYGGPVSTALLNKREDLGRRIVTRLRELGMHAVLPGYFGTVPDDFSDRNPGGTTVPQGDWNGLTRPAWLDPRTSVFRKVAAAYYKHQKDVFGEIRHVKMDLLHEGGKAGNVPVPDAARAVEKALQTALPGATWMILGWQKNPRRELLDSLQHKNRALVVDGLSDLEKIKSRETDWGGVPYAFGTIPNFGGRTTMGAKTQMWAERFTQWRDKSGSKLVGTAYMPESTHRDPLAFELFSELAWREEAVDRKQWFANYARLRYGGDDEKARGALSALRGTAYEIISADGRPHDSIFAARPSLDARAGAHYATHNPAFDLADFDAALTALLDVRESLRGSDAYRYDLADVARQALANRSWLLIGRLKAAYQQEDAESFRKISNLWLSLMKLSDEVAGTHRAFLLGPWLAQARNLAGDEAAEQDKLELTARTLITAWADRPAADKGRLANYANRDWQGLIGDFHEPQWREYLEELEDALADGRTPKSFDWYEKEEAWTREHKTYPQRPSGDVHRTAQRVHAALAKAPFQGSLAVESDPATLAPGSSGKFKAVFRNESGLRATGTVDFSLTGLKDAEPQGSTSVLRVGQGSRAAVSWLVRAPKDELKDPLKPLDYELAVEYGPEGERRVRMPQPGKLYVAGPLDDDLSTVSTNDAVFGQLGRRFAVNGAGDDMWRGTSHFGAVYREKAMRDGVSATVHVTSQEVTGPWARAGLIARNELPGAASRGFVNLSVTPDNGVVLSYDSDGDGELDTYERVSGVGAPVTLRLSRDGRSFHGELSRDDGANWRSVGTVTVSGVLSRQDVGMFMSATNGGTGTRGTVEFRDWDVR